MHRYGFAWNAESLAYVRANAPSAPQLAAAASRRGPIAPHEVLAAIDRDDVATVQFYDRALGLDWELFWRRILRSERVLAWLVERQPTQARLRDLCVRGSPLALRCAELVAPDWYTLFCTVQSGQLATLQRLPWREHDVLCYAVECERGAIVDWLLCAEPPLTSLSDAALFQSRRDAALAQRLIAHFAVDDAQLRRCKLLQGALQAHNRALAAALLERLGEAERQCWAALDTQWYHVPQQGIFRLADRMRRDLEWWQNDV